MSIDRRMKLLVLGPVAILGILAACAVGGVIVQQLWNWLLPSLFGRREITFWEALGLLVLCRILFGGRGGGWAPKPWRSRSSFTPEERERFRQRMRERLGFDQPSGC